MSDVRNITLYAYVIGVYSLAVLEDGVDIVSWFLFHCSIKPLVTNAVVNFTFIAHFHNFHIVTAQSYQFPFNSISKSSLVNAIYSWILKAHNFDSNLSQSLQWICSSLYFQSFDWTRYTISSNNYNTKLQRIFHRQNIYWIYTEGRRPWNLDSVSSDKVIHLYIW